MGIFGNQDPMIGARIGPAPEVSGDSGFAAMGKPVPQYRRQAAYEHLRQMGVEDPEKRWDCVTQMANKLERDEPMLAMEVGYRYVDVTGVYRLMAVLLTAERQEGSVGEIELLDADIARR